MSEPGTSEYDDECRRLGIIMGDALRSQLVNAEYLVSRGSGNPDAVARLRRATELRREDLIAEHANE